MIESWGVTLAGLQQRLGPEFVVDPQMSFETVAGTELPHPHNLMPVSKAICEAEGPRPDAARLDNERQAPLFLSCY